jgi:chemotaxis signal transduction protein
MDLQTRLVELKQRFDASFAEPPPAAAGEYEDVLVIGLGSEQYRVRLREIEGMYPERPLTEVPSHAPHLLGVSDFRGELVAVYDLAALLGYPRAERTRYLLRSSLRTVGFAFERFLGHARLLKQHTGNVADSLEAHAQSIIDIAKLVDTLEQQAASAASGEA